MLHIYKPTFVGWTCFLHCLSHQFPVNDLDILADKTAPPVLSGEIPILQKQNEYHSEKLSPQRDLIGWEHPISLHHCKMVIKDCHQSLIHCTSSKSFSFVICMEWFDWMKHILLCSHFVFILLYGKGNFIPSSTKSKRYFCFFVFIVHEGWPKATLQVTTFCVILFMYNNVNHSNKSHPQCLLSHSKEKLKLAVCNCYSCCA